MGDFVELGAEGINHLTDRYFDSAYDKVKDRKDRRRRKYELPSPERETADYTQVTSVRRGTGRDSSLERQSETSERVLREYENEPDDPQRKVESVLPARELRRDRTTGDMSHANDYASTYAPSRPRSQPPRSRYYDDDDESDYDDREGRRSKATGRGYDDDRDYDREVVETERYRGPARSSDARRMGGYGERDADRAEDDVSGAVAPYRRSQNDVSAVTRPRSRGRRDRNDRDDRDRSYSRSESRSRSGEGFRGKLDEYFETSAQGLGVGIAGAVVGGLAGRQFGHKHKQRDIILGALVGGIGANLADKKYRDWKDDRKDRIEQKEDRWEQKWDGRARSSVR